jgi:large subunit ribosomal protein L30
MGKIRITQVRSGIDRPEKHKRILASLGLRRHQTSRIHDDSPQIRGMVRKISHLVRVDPVEEK